MLRRYLGRQLWLIVFAVLASAMPALAQTATIQGTVKDGQGKAVDDAKVTIEMDGSGRKFESKTDKSGGYMQVGLLGGPYTVTIEKGGVVVKKQAMVRANARTTFDIAFGQSAAP